VSPSLPAEVRRHYPFESHFHSQPAGRQHYLDEGPHDAPVVVMVHGNPTWSFYYRQVIQRLSGQFRCIVPDHLGCGLSDKPQDWDYRLANHMENIERLLDHLEVRRFHLIVHDWGGAIGMGVATRRPTAVGSIVVLNTAAFPGIKIPFRINLCRLKGVGEWIVRRLNAFAGPATKMTTVRPLAADLQRAYLWPYRNWHDRIAIARFVQDIPLEMDHPSRPTLDSIASGLAGLATKPMLIAWGGQDWCFHDWFFEEWKRRFPEAELAYDQNAGHYVLEDSAPEILERIATFLETHD
jgi:haloalkane dehalogenase